MAKLVAAAAAVILAVLAAVSAAGMLVGAPKDVDVNSQGVKDALSYAMYHYNTGNNDMFASRPAEVVRAQSQLVNGFIYDLEVKVGRTNCRKPTTNPNACNFHTEPDLAKTLLCKFKVYTCPWKSEIEVKSMNCS